MYQPILGMICIFGFNFAPVGWALCQGQLIAISQNTALFALLGTYYGGNGQTTFGLPDFRGRAPIGMGQGPGLSPYDLGQMSGAENVTLISTELPQHNHLMQASGDAPTLSTAQNAALASSGRGGSMPNVYVSGSVNNVGLGSSTSLTGGNEGHNNMQPYLAINYSIAMEGIFPSRN